MNSDYPTQLREDAWIGDAVLTLYARSRVLREQGRVSVGDEQLLTSNKFLNSYGEPTQTEACIGRHFREAGLEAAMQWIRDHLEPVYAKQAAKRLKAAGGPKVAAVARKRNRS